MKTVLSLALLVASLSSAALATPVSCPTTTLDAYLVPGFTCVLNSELFSDWGYSASSVPFGLAPPASGIAVNPDATLFDEGFQFSGAWAVAGTGIAEDSLISFTVTGPGLHDLSLFYNGSVTGTGVDSVTEQYCLNHALIGCPDRSTGQIKVTNPPPQFSDQVFFGAVTSVSLSKDIQVASQTRGTAMISQVDNHFSREGLVPEPGTLVLVGAGLLFVGLSARRRRR